MTVIMSPICLKAALCTALHCTALHHTALPYQLPLSSESNRATSITSGKQADTIIILHTHTGVVLTHLPLIQELYSSIYHSYRSYTHPFVTHTGVILTHLSLI